MLLRNSERDAGRGRRLERVDGERSLELERERVRSGRSGRVRLFDEMNE